MCDQYDWCGVIRLPSGRRDRMRLRSPCSSTFRPTRQTQLCPTSSSPVRVADESRPWDVFAALWFTRERRPRARRRTIHPSHPIHPPQSIGLRTPNVTALATRCPPGLPSDLSASARSRAELEQSHARPSRRSPCARRAEDPRRPRFLESSPGDAFPATTLPRQASAEDERECRGA